MRDPAQRDEVELLVSRLELTDSGPEMANGQPSETLCLSEGSPTLGMNEPDADVPIGCITADGRTGRACFGTISPTAAEVSKYGIAAAGRHCNAA